MEPIIQEPGDSVAQKIEVKSSVMDISPPKPSQIPVSSPTTSTSEPAPVVSEPVVSAPATETVPADIGVHEDPSGEAAPQPAAETNQAAPDSAQPAAVKPKKHRPIGMILIVLLVVAMLSGGIVYMYLKKQDDKAAKTKAAAASSAQAAAAAAPAAKVTGTDVDTTANDVQKDLDTAATTDPTGGSNLSDQTLGL